MGRAKGAPAERAAEELAEWLRSLRQLAGLSYSRMAHASTEMGLPISSCTLFRASTGRCLPAWSTVHAYAKACGGSISRARRLWKKAVRTNHRIPAATRRLPPAPALAYISEPFELLQAIRELHLAAGKPSLRELQTAAAVPGGGGSFLPRSTVSAVLNGTRGCTKEVLGHFLGGRRDTGGTCQVVGWCLVGGFRDCERAGVVWVRRVLVRVRWVTSVGWAWGAGWRRSIGPRIRGSSGWCRSVSWRRCSRRSPTRLSGLGGGVRASRTFWRWWCC